MAIDYSIIIPAYNEQPYLPATLAAIATARATITLQGEVIVVDNNSHDDTARIARAAGAEVVFEPINQISRARNAGAHRAKGRYLIFIDADTLVSAELMQTALDNLVQRECVGGGAVVAADKPMPPAMRCLLAAWNWAGKTCKLAAGCFIYCRADAFHAVNGFSEHVYASEELWFSRAIKRWGREQAMAFIMLTNNPVVSSTRKVDWYSSWKIMGWFVLLILLPVAVRFRCLCSPWYERPVIDE